MSENAIVRTAGLSRRDITHILGIKHIYTVRTRLTKPEQKPWAAAASITTNIAVPFFDIAII